MSGKIDTILLDRVRVAFRPSQTYPLAGSPSTIFTITGGPVWIKGLFCRSMDTIASVGTLAVANIASGLTVQMQNAALAITGAINRISMWPLSAVALHVIIPNVGVTPMPTLVAAVAGNIGVVSTTGILQLTVSANVEALEWYCVYQSMHPAAQIV